MSRCRISLFVVRVEICRGTKRQLATESSTNIVQSRRSSEKNIDEPIRFHSMKNVEKVRTDFVFRRGEIFLGANFLHSEHVLSMRFSRRHVSPGKLFELVARLAADRLEKLDENRPDRSSTRFDSLAEKSLFLFRFEIHRFVRVELRRAENRRILSEQSLFPQFIALRLETNSENRKFSSRFANFRFVVESNRNDRNAKFFVVRKRPNSSSQRKSHPVDRFVRENFSFGAFRTNRFNFDRKSNSDRKQNRTRQMDRNRTILATNKPISGDSNQFHRFTIDFTVG